MCELHEISIQFIPLSSSLWTLSNRLFDTNKISDIVLTRVRREFFNIGYKVSIYKSFSGTKHTYSNLSRQSFVLHSCLAPTMLLRKFCFQYCKSRKSVNRHSWVQISIFIWNEKDFWSKPFQTSLTCVNDLNTFFRLQAVGQHIQNESSKCVFKVLCQVKNCFK